MEVAMDIKIKSVPGRRIFVVLLIALVSSVSHAGSPVEWGTTSSLFGVNTAPNVLEVYDDSGRSIWAKTVESRIAAFSLSPDSRRLAYAVAGDSIRIVDFETKGEMVVYRSLNEGWVKELSWSPDGKNLVLVMLLIDPQRNSIRMNQRPSVRLINAVTGDGTNLQP